MDCKAMFRVFGLALAFTMLCQGVTAKDFSGSPGVSKGVFACAEDDFETDDDFDSASLINLGDVQNRSICPVGDQDFAQFTLDDVTNVIIETSGESGDTMLTLYDETFNELARNDDKQSGVYFSLIKYPNLPSGIYYIKVEEFGNNQEIGAYTLSLQTCTPDCTGKVCGDDGCGGSCGECAANEQCNDQGQCEKVCDFDQYEPDNDFTQAVVIGLGESQDHSICPADDVDTVKFTLDEPTQVIIETTGPAGGDTVLVLFDAEGNQIAENDDKQALVDRYSKILIRLDAGDYYAQVTSFSQEKVVESYTITVSACVPQCEGKVCGDDGCGGECPPGCSGDQVCGAGQCYDPWPASCLGDLGPSAKTCPEGITDIGCCDSGRLVFCWEGELWCLDCGLDGNVCGWYPGDWFYPPGYYCGPEDLLYPEDPSGQYPVQCPGTGPCEPRCEGKECGPDGCGGSCGECPNGGLCVQYHCVAPYPVSCLGLDIPSALSCPEEGLTDIGCCDEGNRVVWCEGGKLYCIDCPTYQTTCGWNASAGYYDCGGQGADPSGQNPLECGFCLPSCFGKECGDDGCGGLCGTCQEGYTCNNGICECVPQCEGKECGPDGCGGTCPPGCEDGQICIEWHCCTPNCEGKECGDNGCGGICGECDEGEVCVEGLCCRPNCEGKECGDDGCGGSCGTCGTDETCKDGQCEPICVPNCAGKECGDDGCGGTCGTCGENETCVEGQCQPTCVPNCEGKECGDDGCGGSCGTCAENATCEEGRCKPRCVPNCEGKECGNDGCGGLCGTCQEGYQCSTDGKCVATGGGGGGGGGCTAQGESTSTNPILMLMLGALTLFLALRRRYN